MQPCIGLNLKRFSRTLRYTSSWYARRYQYHECTSKLYYSRHHRLSGASFNAKLNLDTDSNPHRGHNAAAKEESEHSASSATADDNNSSNDGGPDPGADNEDQNRDRDSNDASKAEPEPVSFLSQIEEQLLNLQKTMLNKSNEHSQKHNLNLDLDHSDGDDDSFAAKKSFKYSDLFSSSSSSADGDGDGDGDGADDDDSSSTENIAHWKQEFASLQSENHFDLEHVTFANNWSVYVDYLRVKEVNNRLFHSTMNSFITQFSHRFLCYEELYVGCMNGFKFAVDCLLSPSANNNDGDTDTDDRETYAALESCLVPEIFSQIGLFRHALLGAHESSGQNQSINVGNGGIDGQYSHAMTANVSDGGGGGGGGGGECFDISGCLLYVQHMKVQRQESFASPDSIPKVDWSEFKKDPSAYTDEHRDSFLVPVEMFVEIRYYYQLQNEEKTERFADFVWHSKWNASKGKYELDRDGWVVNHVSIHIL